MKVIITLLLALYSFPLLAQDMNLDKNLTGTGVKGVAMGGAFLSIADDASAISWNPAGIAKSDKQEMLLLTRYNHYKADNPAVSYNSSIKHSNFGIKDLTYTFPLKMHTGKLNCALAYQEQAYFGYDVDGLTITQTIRTGSLGTGFYISRCISLGLAVNYWNGSLHQTGPLLFTSDEIKATLSGVNITAGFLNDGSKAVVPIPLSYGLVVHSGFDFHQNMKLNSNDYNISAKTSVRYPVMLCGGASFRLSPDMTIAAALEDRYYTQSNEKDEEGYEDQDFHKRDLVQFHAGLEYRLHTSTVAIPLRFGYKTIPTEFRDSNTDQFYNTYYGSYVNGVGYSVGTSLPINDLSLDLAFEMKDYQLNDGIEYHDYTAYLGATFLLSKSAKN